jgi:hypothetical protein
MFMQLPRWKQRHYGRALHLSWVLALTFTWLTSVHATAADFPLRTYPVPVNVDSSLVRSNMYLHFEMKDYNLSLEDFRKSATSPEEQLFLRAADTIHVKNPVALADIWGDPRPKKELTAGAVKVSEITPKQVVAEYAADFADLHKPKLIGEVLVGSTTLFVWETSSDGTPTRLGFQVNTDDKNKLWIKDLDSFRDPIASLIVLTMNEALRNPAGYKAVDNPNTKFRYAFPLAGKGNPGKHPVFLYFSGQAFDFPVYSENKPAPTPLLAEYRQTYLAFKNKNYAEFTAAHTAESQIKLKEFMQLLSGNNGPQAIQRLTANKFVKFVLDADPVYFVFYGGFAGTDWPPGSLGYDYVYKDPGSGKFLLTNFLFQGFWDGVFRDTNLFNQLIFKPAIKPAIAKPQKSK